MLKQLDTVIGFAVVMSVVSLLITIATQMVSGLLALRGKNLANALQALVLRIDPHLEDKVSKELADWILTDDLISDSVFSMRKWKVFKWFSNSWLGVVWERASAIRADELVHILRKLAADGSPPDPTVPIQIRETAASLIGILEIPS